MLHRVDPPFLSKSFTLLWSSGWKRSSWCSQRWFFRPGFPRSYPLRFWSSARADKQAATLSGGSHNSGMFSWPSGQNHEHHKCLARPWKDLGGLGSKGNRVENLSQEPWREKKAGDYWAPGKWKLFSFFSGTNTSPHFMAVIFKVFTFLCTEISALPLNRLCCRVWGQIAAPASAPAASTLAGVPGSSRRQAALCALCCKDVDFNENFFPFPFLPSVSSYFTVFTET